MHIDIQFFQDYSLKRLFFLHQIAFVKNQLSMSVGLFHSTCFNGLYVYPLANTTLKGGSVSSPILFQNCTVLSLTYKFWN